MEGASGAHHHRDPFKSSGELSFLSFRAKKIPSGTFVFFENVLQLDQTFLAFMLLRRNHNVRGSIDS
jgi:hypothetical protein